MKWRTQKRILFLIFAAGVLLLILSEELPYRLEVAIGLMALYTIVFWIDNYQLSRYEPEAPIARIVFARPHYDPWLILLLLLLVFNAFLIDHDFPVFTVVTSGLLIATIGDALLQKLWSTHRLIITDEHLIHINRKVNKVYFENLKGIKHHRDHLHIYSKNREVKLYYRNFSNRQFKELEAALKDRSKAYRFQLPEGFFKVASKKIVKKST